MTVINSASDSALTRARTVLITGTSSGIGLHTAIAAAASGWNTIATMRELSRSGALREAAAAAGVDIVIRRLDVTDETAVAGAIDECAAMWGTLDAVVNNAGSASVGTVEVIPLDQFRDAMEVNFFGSVMVTRAALPHLRRAHGRMVAVSSVGGAVGQPFNDAYCAAKFALEGFLESLQPAAKMVGVGVHVIEPGAVLSEFINNARMDPAAMIREAGAYGPALANYLERTASAFSGSNAQTPTDVARIIVDTLEADDPPFRIQTSDWARAFVGTKFRDIDGSTVTRMTSSWVS